MRGIINYFRTASFEVRVFGWSNTLENLRSAMAMAFHDHAALYSHSDGASMGTVTYLRIPFTRLSVMIEWSSVSFGGALERTQGGLDIYCGRLKASFCREQGQLYRSHGEAL